MEDKKAISIRKLAALERAKALGLPVRVPMVSVFEREAQKWKQQEVMERSEVGSRKSEIQGPKSNVSSPMPEVEGPVFQIEHPAPRKSDDRETGEGFNWKPYESESEQGKVERKPKNLNPASIAAMARKIMAREWAMALGRGGGEESEKAAIERKAEQFRQKKVAERARKEIEEKRANEQRKGLEEALRSFGRALLKAPKPATPEMAETLLEKALAGAGEFISIIWLEDGCCILMEPWEEKRLRRKNKEDVPAVFQATIDDNLMLRSYERVKNPEVLQQTQNDLILKNILSSFRRSPQKDFHAFEDAVAERGRIIQSTKMNGGWKTHFEPWHEVRTRNVERGGQPPIVTYVLKADKDFEHISCKRI